MLELTLPAMTCGHCVRTVTETAREVDPSATVDTGLAAQRVRTDSQSDRRAFEAALTEVGYPRAV